MQITISSGNSVDEVCRALWHFYHYIKKRYNFEVVTLEYAKCENGFKSILLESSDEGLLSLEGTHLWRSQSPFRPKHKRKNWYFTLKAQEEQKAVSVDEQAIIYQTMKSPKKGGQHVNTTSSGVRAIYPPLGIETISYDERSQHRNKQIAKARLLEKIALLQSAQRDKSMQKRWKAGKELERGNAVKVFEGEEFVEVVR